MTLSEILSAWPALLGWPAIFAAITLAAASAYTKKPLLAFVAAFLIMPISYYLIGGPAVGWLGALPMALLVALGVYLARTNRRATD